MANSDSLESLIDDLALDLNHQLSEALIAGSDVAISSSLVYTGRFISSWRIGIDSFTPESNTQALGRDGNASALKIRDSLGDFDIMTNSSISLYNDATDPETGYHYASTVGFDGTGQKARIIISNTEQMLYSRLN